MSRHRTIPDASVLQAAFRVISRLGPNQFTLADIAKESGLAPATLIQRFGSKRGLLLALAKGAAEGAGGCFAKVRAGNRSPLKALFATFREMARLAKTPEVLANSMAFLQMDLTDPEFRRWTLVNSRATLAGFRDLLEDAIRAGELVKCDTQGLARLIQAAAHGSMVSWAFHQEGKVEEWVRRDMELLLRPYRVARKKKGTKAR
ncbi:MAG: TetR/AcrR family transcriptional regulator [Acidobacteria bacterium]|nr:TetR/AcrR family transcriptional regulator [Acidobacteriota bacterium]MCL5288317.1 TetR/AcrR family transcriptional regulator [Acidobacteriota bacterium]